MPGNQQGLPWQVKAFAGGGEGRMPAYKAAMVLGVAGGAWWWFSSKKDIEAKQEEAVERWGRQGEKAEYGKSFKETTQTEPHFPGIPTSETNAAGGHAGGTKTP